MAPQAGFHSSPGRRLAKKKSSPILLGEFLETGFFHLWFFGGWMAP
jgi:hypothetical protein